MKLSTQVLNYLFHHHHKCQLVNNVYYESRDIQYRWKKESMAVLTRFVFITGGVVSSLGKGLGSAALGALLQARGYKLDCVN